METLLEIPDYPDAEALFAFTDGLQTWARMEIERRGARDLATAISIAESLVEFQRSERSRTSPQKDRCGEVTAKARIEAPQAEGGHPRSQREDRGMQRPPLSCFLCDGPHRARECPKKSKLSALVEEREERPFQPREATMGSLQLSALKVQEKGTVNVEKGRPFVQIEVGGQKLRALLDTGASHNFLTVEEAKRLGIPYEKEMGWLKAVNSTPNLIHGVARDTKAIPMLFANSMCITEGGGTCVVPLLRGKASNTLATMHVEMQDPSAAQGEKQHGKGGGTPKKDLKECKRGHTPKLQKGHPPREKVDCARGNAVARSPRRSHRRGRRVRGVIARGRAGGSAKPREELVHLATGTREVLQEHSRESPKQHCGACREAWEEVQTTRASCGLSGGECHPTNLVSRRSPIFFREVPTEGGSVGVNPCGAKGRCIAGRQCLRESIFGANRPTGQAGELPGGAGQNEGQLGGTGHCHGPIEGSNWEALGTATARRGQMGGTCTARARPGNWEALALPRARRGQLGGLGTATGSSGELEHWALPRPRGQLGGTGHCHGPVRGNWEALGTATGPGATGRHWALPRANRGATGRHWSLPRARRGQLGGTGHCHGPSGGATGRHWALPRACFGLGKGMVLALDL
ncbi:hypothetical protein GH714_044068 [Hevea brasiliensis]|uniref:Peptidase A2 domain-containing protein n=1 Tax=Hevea brasiliensis TaxID=3981 RepID=A0A6A6K4F7_HEVBR|nr:hypothetical protein GH714_044068 [Hevea brasiliensis]